MSSPYQELLLPLFSTTTSQNSSNSLAKTRSELPVPDYLPPPLKPGRKRKGADPVDPTASAIHRTLRNRYAAQLSRERKRKRLEELEVRTRELELENLLLKERLRAYEDRISSVEEKFVSQTLLSHNGYKLFEELAGVDFFTPGPESTSTGSVCSTFSSLAAADDRSLESDACSISEGGEIIRKPAVLPSLACLSKDNMLPRSGFLLPISHTSHPISPPCSPDLHWFSDKR